MKDDDWPKAADFVEKFPEACAHPVPKGKKGAGMYALHSVAHRDLPPDLALRIIELTPDHAVNSVGGQAGASPLHMAVSTNKTDLVRVLIEMRADVNLKNTNGKTPLDKSNTAGKETVNILRRAGAVYSEGNDRSWGSAGSSRGWAWNSSKWWH